MANGNPAAETVEIDGVVLNADDVLRAATELRKVSSDGSNWPRVPKYRQCPTCGKTTVGRELDDGSGRCVAF